MRFENGRLSKRCREPQFFESRPRKKSSPTPSECDLNSIFEARTPTASPVKWDPGSADKLSILSPLSRDFAQLSLLRRAPSPLPRRRRLRGTHRIFEMPEILENILRQVAVVGGGEGEQTRAKRARGPLSSCLLVNRLWHVIALQCLLERMHFRDPKRLSGFLQNGDAVLAANGGKARPFVFIVQKSHRLSQADLDRVAALVAADRLKWLELYICPNVLPPMSWVPNFRELEKLILPGNKVVDDKFLLGLSHYVPNLARLDLRACDNVTDSGVIAIALRCRKLQLCNLGRHRNGHRITSVSVVALAKHTQIETLGVAGCKVTDAGIWELAQLRGPHITRLSLNNCPLLSNHSVPMLLAFNHFPNLAVLEVRNIGGITDVRNLVHFKLWKKSQRIPILIEGCDRITRLMSEEEARIRRANSLVALKDMTHWINN